MKLVMTERRKNYLVPKGKKNKKVIELMKDELVEEIMTEFV